MFEKVIYTVQKIDGDYAFLISDSGIENQVAMALLPQNVCEGDKIKFENFEYEVI